MHAYSRILDEVMGCTFLRENGVIWVRAGVNVIGMVDQLGDNWNGGLIFMQRTLCCEAVSPATMEYSPAGLPVGEKVTC